MQENVVVGIEIVTKAVEHDQANRIQEAIYLYDLSVEFFNKGLSFTHPSDQSVLVIQGKIQEYTARSNRLKQSLLGQTTSIPTVGAKFLQEGISAAEQAVEEDKCKRFVQAEMLYRKALENFSYVLNYETNESIRSTIKEKMSTYFVRVEQLTKLNSQGSISTMSTGSIPIFGLKPGQQYVDPVQKKGFMDSLREIGKPKTISDSWLKKY